MKPNIVITVDLHDGISSRNQIQGYFGQKCVTHSRTISGL